MKMFLKRCVCKLKNSALLYGICLFGGMYFSCGNNPEAAVYDSLVWTLDTIPILSINEILFDPLGDGSDYVEVVNTSGDTLDLSLFYITNRNSKGVLNAGKRLSSAVCRLVPGAYCLLTDDTASLAAAYRYYPDSLTLVLKNLPSIPNDGGSVVIYDDFGEIIDECPYSKNWHHVLISDKEGIALEKIHPCLPSSQAASWTSASKDAGFGTPGYENSQYRWAYAVMDGDSILGSGGSDGGADDLVGGLHGGSADGFFEKFSEGFFPDRNWIAPTAQTAASQLCLFYRFQKSCVANISIYNRDGILMEKLAENALLGAKGVFVWQGVTAEGEILPCGQYLIDIVCYSLDGMVDKWQFVCGIYPSK